MLYVLTSIHFHSHFSNYDVCAAWLSNESHWVVHDEMDWRVWRGGGSRFEQAAPLGLTHAGSMLEGVYTQAIGHTDAILFEAMLAHNPNASVITKGQNKIKIGFPRCGVYIGQRN